MTTEKLLWGIAGLFILAFFVSAFMPVEVVSNRLFAAMAAGVAISLWFAKRESEKNEAKLELRKRLKSAGIQVTEEDK